jgi:cell division protein FtsZ
MSLSEMPALKSKADQESVDQSFKLPSSEFDVEAEFKISVPEIDLLEEDEELHFEVKESPVVSREELDRGFEEKDASMDVDMERPISQLPKRNMNEFPEKMKERMNRLQNFQYKFKANLQNLADAERIPAYMRQGMDVDLQHRSEEGPSNLGVDAEGNIRTNNSFLHDNVD